MGIENNFRGMKSTIAHRQLFLWVDDNFVPGYYELEFTGEDIAVITDRNNEKMTIRYSNKDGVTVVD